MKKDLESCQKGASVTAEGNESILHTYKYPIHWFGWCVCVCPARVNASEEKFVKLKEVYSKLRNEHIQLLRTEGEGRKKLQVN